LRGFFVSLTLADPAVAVGLVRRWRRSGRAALVVLAADVAVHGYANHVMITAPGITSWRVGHRWFPRSKQHEMGSPLS
jgi:hypothetical protein